MPVCTRLSLTADNEIGVRAKDLKAIKLEDLRDDIYGYIGVFTPNPAGGWVRKVGRGSYRQDHEHVQQATTRRKLTPKFLKKVAEIHSSASGGGGFGAVKAAFADVDERQVRRYIAAARQKRFSRWVSGRTPRGTSANVPMAAGKRGCPTSIRSLAGGDPPRFTGRPPKRRATSSTKLVTDSKSKYQCRIRRQSSPTGWLTGGPPRWRRRTAQKAHGCCTRTCRGNTLSPSHSARSAWTSCVRRTSRR